MKNEKFYYSELRDNILPLIGIIYIIFAFTWVILDVIFFIWVILDVIFIEKSLYFFFLLIPLIFMIFGSIIMFYCDQIWKKQMDIYENKGLK